MSDHHLSEHPDLVAFLRGEVGIDEALRVEDHLTDCSRCRDDLVATATGHALLERGASVPAGPSGLDELPTPPPFVAPSRLPDARRSRWLPAVAAVAVLAAGVGIGVAGSRGSDDGRPGVQDSVSAALDPVDGSGTGQVEMVVEGNHSTRMTVRTEGLPSAPDGGFYYVWLLDPTTNKMLPLGVVGPGGTATFGVDESLLAAYSAVDVSLETDDGDPGHSVTSVLRGSYAT